MKPALSITCSLILLIISYLKKHSDSVKIDHDAYNNVILKKKLSQISCTPDWSTYYLSDSEVKDMMPLPGTGLHSWKISTSNDSAQFYFNQGINLYYGFHIIESLSSFKKAQLFDSGCAMLYWAEALAYGPNINDGEYTAPAQALAASSKALSFIKKANQTEKDLIGVMSLRYTTDTTQKRVVLNQVYSNNMETLYLKHPKDPEIGSLYVDAMMNLHPWEWWENDGRPKPWTPKIQMTLEKVLKISPNHPGANHYYIHIMEASPYASKAIGSADKLGNLTPGLSHMVHMPSHIYVRTGNYNKGVKVNEMAVDRYHDYKKLYPNVSSAAGLYEIHNLHMQAACSMNTGIYYRALNDAYACRKSVDTILLSSPAPLGDYYQYVFMTPVITMVTFQKWSDVLKLPEVDKKFHYASLIENFAKGVAYARLGNIPQAKQCLKKLNQLIQEKDIAVVMPPMNAPITAATVQKFILQSAIAEGEHNYLLAINYSKAAVKTEASLIYNEPRDWLIPATHFLGIAYIANKQENEAIKTFREDLKMQPNNYFARNQLSTLKTMK